MILSGDDAFDPFANNPTARERWEEHQRRQRSSRFLMTFIMMLLLLDGDQETAAGRRNGQQRSNLRPKEVTPERVSVLQQDLWDLRREFDEQVMEVAVGTERFEKLLGLNDGVREEELIWTNVRQELEEEAAALETEKEDGERETKSKKSADRLLEAEQETELEPDDRLIWHYPRNATGYYKGEWKRINPTDAGTAFELLETTQKDGEGEVSPSLPPIRINETYRGPLQPFVTERELLTQLKETNPIAQSARMGLFLLPNGTQLPLFSSQDKDLQHALDLLNSTDFTSLTDDDQTYSSTTRTTIRTRTTTQENVPFLEITKSSGKAYFHFYKRSIPGMTSLSLLDGYLKLSDISDAGFASPLKNLLVRVQGILIHPLGKISLVANDVSSTTYRNGRRHAFVMFPDEDERNKRDKKKGMEAMDDPTFSWGGKSHEGEEEERRHLLEQSIQNAFKSSKTDQHVGAESSHDVGGLEQIRQEALTSYSHLFDKHDVGGGKDWEEYSSSFQPHELESFLSSKETSSVGRRRLENKTSKKSKEGKDENSTSPLNETVIANQTHMFSLDSHVHPFPYVPNSEDEKQSFDYLPLKMERDTPPELLFEHGLGCEFEVEMDIKEEQWSHLNYKTMIKRLLKELDSTNPHHINGKDEAEISSQYRISRTQKDYVMGLTGTIISPNCNFASSLNVTAVRPNWEKVTSKAINYCFIMMIASFVQILVLFRQLIHTQRQSMAIRVSMTSIGWQTVLDAMMCISHILLCMVLQPASTAFAMVAFFKLIIFCVIEMKYLVIIMQNRSNAEGNTLNSDELRAKVAILHFRFYCALILTNVFLWHFGDYRKLCFLLMFSFWVPQIMLNIYTETKNVLHEHYIYGMSVTRLIPPLYFYAVPNNFLKEHDPDFGPLDPLMCKLLFLYVGLQCGILIAQNKYGPRFMIPAR